MRISLLYAVLSICLALSSFLADRSAHAFDMGELSDIIQPRSDADWTVTNEGGAAVLENRNSPYAITYYYVSPRPGDEGRREISVDVGMMSSERDSLAGILYGFEEDPKSYFLFTVGGDRSVNLHFFDQGNMQEKMKLTSSDLRADKTTLTIRENGNEISLLVNGVEKSAIGNDRIGRGAVGIVAAHLGTYSFRNFGVATPDESASLNPAPNRSDEAQPDEMLIVKRAEIMDNQAPFGPMAAGSTLIPADWRIESRIEWYPTTYCKRGPQLTWAALSPDDRYGVASIGGFNWSVQDVPLTSYGCLQQDIQDAEAAIQAFVAQVPGASLIEIMRPQEIEPLVGIFRGMTTVSVPNTQTYVDGALARATFTENGRTSETAILMISNHTMMSVSDVFGNMGQNRSGSAVFMMLFSAPEGKLDEGHPAFAMVMQNYQPNPVWDRNANQWWAQQRGALQRPAPAATTTSSGGGKTVGDILFEGYKNRSGMNDAGQRRSVEAIWDVNTYQAGSETRTFSTQYDQVWELNDGRFALTNDAFFNPDRNIGIGGTQLQRVP